MKNKIVSIFCAAFFSQLFMIGAAMAARSYVDFTDIWYDATVDAEGKRPNSGWGMNIIQSGNSFDYMFATLFIYDPATGEPTWVTGELKLDTVSKADVFTGALYRHVSQPTTTPFNPSNLDSQEVGTLKFTATAPDKATISYSVNGMNVEREVVRQSLTENIIASSTGYWGSAILTYGNCNVEPQFANMTLVIEKQKGIAKTKMILYMADNITCTFTGSLAANGRTASIDKADYVCKKGSSTVWDIKADVSNIVVTTQGIEGEWITTKKIDNIGCKETGRFSAVLY